MSCGIPVLTSRLSAIPEVCADAAIYFNPHDPEDLKNKIFDLYYDNSKKNDLIKKLKRVSGFLGTKGIPVPVSDKEIEKIQTVNVNVTAESMDAHVHVLRLNGYSVQKAYYRFTQLAVSLLLGGYIVGFFIK